MRQDAPLDDQAVQKGNLMVSVECTGDHEQERLARAERIITGAGAETRPLTRDGSTRMNTPPTRCVSILGADSPLRPRGSRLEPDRNALRIAMPHDRIISTDYGASNSETKSDTVDSKSRFARGETRSAAASAAKRVWPFHLEKPESPASGPIEPFGKAASRLHEASRAEATRE
jgi:hypothetical protein